MLGCNIITQPQAFAVWGLVVAWPGQLRLTNWAPLTLGIIKWKIILQFEGCS